MHVAEWAVLIAGLAVAAASVVTWLLRRHEAPAPDVVNPGLIQPNATPGPPGSVSPGMVAALLSGTVEPKNLFLTMVDLAVRGYLRLGQNRSGHWVIIRTSKPARGLRDFEATLLGKPGTKETLTALVEHDQATLQQALDELRSTVARAGWFAETGAQKRRTPWPLIGGVVILLGLAAAVVSLIAGFKAQPWLGLIGAALMIASGLLLISLTKFEPSITAVGNQTKAQVQRYREWLDHLQPHDLMPDIVAPVFNDNLAPALAFGQETAFAKVFDTAAARHQNWGKTLDIPTDWLASPDTDLASRVKLLRQFIDDGIALAARTGWDQPED